MELEYYRKALSLIDGTVDEDDRVVGLGDPEVKFKVAKRFLVLPTKAILKKSDWEKEIPFHPLCETGISNKRSIILDKFIELANFNLDIRLRNVINLIAENLSNKVTMPPDAMSLLSAACPEAAENLKKDANKIFIAPITTGKIPTASERVLTVSLKRNTEHDKKKYKAVATVKCIPYDDEDDEKHFFGVKCTSKQNVRSLKGIVDLVVGGLDSLEIYTTATNTPLAPLWTAYTKTVGKIHEHLNGIIDTFELTDKFEVVDTGFLEMNAEAAKIKVMVPTMADSRGEYLEKDLAEDAAPVTQSREVNQRPTTVEPEKQSVFSQAVNGVNSQPSFNRNVGYQEPQGSIFAQAARAQHNPNLGYNSTQPRGRPGTGGNTRSVGFGGFSRSLL